VRVRLAIILLIFPATAQAGNLSDTRIGKTETALRAQARHSHLVVRFFERHPQIAVQWRKSCTSLKLSRRERNCRTARNIIRLHRWLRKESRERLEALYTPTVAWGVWGALASCESGQDWSYNGGSGFDGGLQFHPGTWSSYRLPGYPAYAYQASAAQQIAVAERVLADQGWLAWPACSLKLGLR
jgi:hypothetical protein